MMVTVGTRTSNLGAWPTRYTVLTATLCVVLLLTTAHFGDCKKKSNKATGTGGRSTPQNTVGTDRISEEQMREAEQAYAGAQTAEKSGDFREALRLMTKVLEISPTQAQVHFESAYLHLRFGDLSSAERAWEQAVLHDPTFTTAYFNLGSVRAELGLLDKSLEALEVAVSLEPNSGGTYKSIGIIYQKKGDHDRAVEMFDKCVQLAPDNADCECGAGNSFVRLGRINDATHKYSNAVRKNPTEAGFHNNVGNLLVRHHPFNATAQKEAIGFLLDAVRLDGQYGAAYYNLGNAWCNLKDYDKGLQMMQMASDIEPDRMDYKCSVSLQKRQAADWSNYDDHVLQIEKTWLNGTMAGHGHPLQARIVPPKAKRPGVSDSDRSSEESLCPQPLESLSWPLRPQTLRSIAESHGEQIIVNTRAFTPYLHDPRNPIPLAGGSPGGFLSRATPGNKLRLAYVSIELRDRPVGRDMLHALGDHPLQNIEVLCFALHPLDAPGPDASKHDPASAADWKARLSAVCGGGLWDIAKMSYSEGAAVVNKAQAHVALNLDGWTSAPVINELFALKPAPVAVNFKGYAGTLGCPFIDHLVGDRVATPPEFASFYSERLVVMPHSYHYNGHMHLYPPGSVDEAAITRAAYGLPEDAVIYANYNQFYKLTPETFDAWMRILKAVPTAHMWLLNWNAKVADRLRGLAERAGVSSSRFIFSTPFPLALHVAIKGLADVHLDSAPYSAHGTAADALYAGVPVLTSPGHSMASRVAASLNIASGVTSFTTMGIEDYVQQAIAWGTSIAATRRLRATHVALRRDAVGTAAFDSPRFALLAGVTAGHA